MQQLFYCLAKLTTNLQQFALIFACQLEEEKEFAPIKALVLAKAASQLQFALYNSYGNKVFFFVDFLKYYSKLLKTRFSHRVPSWILSYLQKKLTTSFVVDFLSLRSLSSSSVRALPTGIDQRTDRRMCVGSLFSFFPEEVE